MKEKDSKEVEKKTKNATKSEKIKEKKPPESSQEYMEQAIAKRQKTIKISIIAIVVIILMLILTTGFAFTSMTNSKIIKGISINGLDVSGLTKEEALKLIEEKIKERQEAIVKLKYKDYEKELSMEQLTIEADAEGAVNKAISKGRSGNILQNNIAVLKSKFSKENIEIDLKFNEEVLDNFLNETSVELPGAVKEYTYSIEEEELIITKGTDGIVIDKEKMKKDIKEEITNLSKTLSTERNIDIKEEKAKEIDIEYIYNEIHTEPQDAYIIDEPFEIVVDKDGIDFAISMEEAKAILQEEKEEYIIPLKVTKANKTVADLGERAFPDLLASYTTRYDAGNVNRSTNLSTACKKINNYVLQPGETFSYNQTLGKRTVENGFREAHIFTSSGVEDGMGGGICQISSTLYNTVVLSNLDIVERHNHMYDPEYVDQGRDATVSYGSLDFKFKNTRKYPIKISAYISGGVATVSIYGIKEENEPKVQISSTVTSTIPCAVKTIEDSSLAAGEEQVVTRGMNGYKSVTYKYLYYPDGRVEKIQLSADSYATITKVVKVGTQKIETPVEPQTPAEPVEPQESPEIPPTSEPTPPAEPEMPEGV
ncbi:MAG: VanW family protein [Clostridia bacterium]|nr:VanW family protein [Clostridia bacterium]